jgi:ArsR family metal-binding transcriptional regulator
MRITKTTRGAEMLIQSYQLEMRLSTHSAEHIECEAIAHVGVDISPVLPYLNATLSSGIYMPDKLVLSWRYEGHNIGFWPDRIAVDNLESHEHGEQMVERLVNLVNQTWEKRDQLEPDFTTHQRLQPLELYQLLPRTNCKICGQGTCFNFALQLVAAQAGLESCTPLYDESIYQDQRARLESLLATKWPAL